LFKSSTFKSSGPPTILNRRRASRSYRETPARHAAVVEAARLYAAEHRAIVASIQSPELRKSAQR
jgi:hypothetical protein